jgi:hypothetical protein
MGPHCRSQHWSSVLTLRDYLHPPQHPKTTSSAPSRLLSSQPLSESVSAARRAAVLDHGLNDTDGNVLCGRLTERGVPFIIYSGNDKPADFDGMFITKPALPGVLVGAVEGLLRAR